MVSRHKARSPLILPLWSALTSKTFLFGVKNPSYLSNLGFRSTFSSGRREHKEQKGTYAFLSSLSRQWSWASTAEPPCYPEASLSGAKSPEQAQQWRALAVEASSLMGSGGSSHRHPSGLLLECHCCYSSSYKCVCVWGALWNSSWCEGLGPLSQEELGVGVGIVEMGPVPSWELGTGKI